MSVSFSDRESLLPARGTSRGCSGNINAQTWSLFPSTEKPAPDMNIYHPTDRAVPAEVSAVSRALPATATEQQRTMASPPRDIPLYRPAALSPRRPPPELSSNPPGTFENTRPLTAFVNDERLYPPRSSSKLRAQYQEIQAVQDNAMKMSSSIQSPTSATTRVSSPDPYETNGTSYPAPLPALQSNGADDQPDPLAEEDLDPGSFDLVSPPDLELKQYSLETRSEQLFSTEHLRTIFDDPELLLRFTFFMSRHRPASIPILIYYLDSVKALKALAYHNAVVEELEPIRGFAFTLTRAKPSTNFELEQKSELAFDALVREHLPAYITHTYIQTVSLSIQRRITGTLPAHLQEASEGLAEVFCLTDPSRPDNPIVFASEEFNRTTQYGMGYAIGRNCRFLQGPKTNVNSVRRLAEKIEAGVEHCEVFLNYRRDGSPFMNLLMISPLKDSRGVIRYFIGAQVDVSGLVKECSDMESLKRLVAKSEHAESDSEEAPASEEKTAGDEFQELSEMLNLQELDTVRRWGGRMHKIPSEEKQDSNLKNGNANKARLLINSPGPDGFQDVVRSSGKLSGVFENYLLVRAYPSLRVLFASPSMRVPGILQSPFMNKIGGSQRVRDDLTQAFADGRGVTARVRWISKTDPEGYSRWIHCTPLLGANGAIGVWMIVIVTEEDQQPGPRRFKQAMAIDPKYGRTVPFSEAKEYSTKDFAPPKRPGTSGSMHGGSIKGDREGSLRTFSLTGTERSGSPFTVRID